MSGARARRADAGFTLAELLLVVGILAVLAAIAVPRFAGLRGTWEFEESARLLVADLRSARTEAHRRGGPVEVVFEAAHYEVVFTRPFETAASPDFADRAGIRTDGGERIVLHRRTRPRGMRWFHPPEAIRFHPNGTARGGTIRLTSEELSGGLRITVDPVLGETVGQALDEQDLASSRWPSSSRWP